MIGRPANGRGWVLATVLAVALAGCGHGAKHTPSAGASPTTVATTTTTSPNDVVIAAWRHYWDVYIAVGEQMHLPDPRLAQVATGEELRTLGGAFLADESEGHILKGSIDLDPKVVSVQDATAQVSDCYFSHILVYDQASGRPTGPGSSSRTLVSATLALDSGVWKVAAIRHEADDCSAP